MLPLDLVRRPAFTTANTVAGVMNLGTLGLLFLLTLYLQTVQHRSALAAGIAVLPLFLPLAVLAPIAGRVVAWIGPKLPTIVGLGVAAAGVTLLVRLAPDSGYGTLLAVMLAWGIGIGIHTPAVVAAAVGAVDADRSGLASRGEQHRPAGRRSRRHRDLRRARRPADGHRRLPRRVPHRCADHFRPVRRRRGHRPHRTPDTSTSRMTWIRPSAPRPAAQRLLTDLDHPASDARAPRDVVGQP
jgi:hypothetical protein